MAAPSPTQSQFGYGTSTPPPPPPKPTGHSSGRGTPTTGPPLPPPPPSDQYSTFTSPAPTTASSSIPNPSSHPSLQAIPAPDPTWLPSPLSQQTSTADLSALLHNLALQSALLNNPSTTHDSLPASQHQLSTHLAANLALAHSLTQLETHLRDRRTATQSALLSLRALERQWRAKQAEQDGALRDFSAPALYQRLVAAVGEGEETCRAMEESFLHGGESGGKMGEREVQEFVRRYREARKVAFLRKERKERWDEGRVGGWR